MDLDRIPTIFCTLALAFCFEDNTVREAWKGQMKQEVYSRLDTSRMTA